MLFFSKFKKLKKGVLLCTDVLSRGIDIDDVEWVIQYDPPSCASSFVHRCGRTARQDRSGNAVVFLLPNEDTYVKFIEINQNVPLEVYDKKDRNNDVDGTIEKVRQLASKEREIYEKGKEAFVSFIQSYSKHECSHLFRIKELDLASIALGFGLLHLPKMPEIRKIKNIQFQNYDVDCSKIAFKDKARETLRQKRIQENGGEARKSKKPVRVKSVAWSDKVEVKLKRKIRKEKKEISQKKAKRKTIDDDELNELQADFKLLKKLKKRKITEKEFDEQFVSDDESENKKSS